MDFFATHQVPVTVALSMLLVALVAAVGMKSRNAGVGLGIVLALAIAGWWAAGPKVSFTMFEVKETKTVPDPDFPGSTIEKEVWTKEFRPGLLDFVGPVAAGPMGGAALAVAYAMWQARRKAA